MMAEAFGVAWQERGTLKVRFKGPAYPGDQVTTFGHVVRESERDGETLVECAVGLKNQDGTELITGTASVRIPTTQNTESEG